MSKGSSSAPETGSAQPSVQDFYQRPRASADIWKDFNKTFTENGKSLFLWLASPSWQDQLAGFCTKIDFFEEEITMPEFLSSSTFLISAVRFWPSF